MNSNLFLFSLIILSFKLAVSETKKKLPDKLLTMSEIISSSPTSDWKTLDPENTLYMELTSGRVIIALASQLTPQHVKNVKTLAREKYWDGLAIVRVQDNYVVQWADPNSEKSDLKRKIKTAQSTLPAEFEQSTDLVKNFVKLPDGDIYAPEVGFLEGFPVGRDPKTKKIWMLHCYGAIGAGRDNSIDSGGGAELYAVIGHSPRHLDRTITSLGRVVQGVDLLSALPRGKGPMGFYDKPELNVPIKSIRVASDVPAAERVDIEFLKTESQTFKQVIESRRHRPEEWFSYRSNKIEICNVPIPIRIKPKNQ